MSNKMRQLISWLEHPLTKGLDLDDPRTTLLRKRVIREKPILFEVYDEWYKAIISNLPDSDLFALEIGAGASFFSEFHTNLISSDIFLIEGMDVVLDCQHLPFINESLNAIVMTDVFHHLQEPRKFLFSATRCLKKDGLIIMIEPWVTPWSHFIYKNFHHEPFFPNSINWEFPVTGPLSGANGALPWIIFHRDRDIFEREYPKLKVNYIKLLMPILYPVSGGISSRNLVPKSFIKPLKWFDKTLSPIYEKTAMFAMIVIRKK